MSKENKIFNHDYSNQINGSWSGYPVIGKMVQSELLILWLKSDSTNLTLANIWILVDNFLFYDSLWKGKNDKKKCLV